jgi:hypothetical protein
LLHGRPAPPSDFFVAYKTRLIISVDIKQGNPRDFLAVVIFFEDSKPINLADPYSYPFSACFHQLNNFFEVLAVFSRRVSIPFALVCEQTNPYVLVEVGRYVCENFGKLLDWIFFGAAEHFDACFKEFSFCENEIVDSVKT